MLDPIEVLLPAGDCIFTVIHVEESRECISFIPRDDLSLDLSHSPVMKTFVSKQSNVGIAILTHLVSFSIAPSTDWLS